MRASLESFLSLIISFLVQLQHRLVPYQIITSSQVRVGTPLPLLLCCISDLGPEGLLHNHTIPVWTPGNLLGVTLASRGNSASKNLQRETQQPNCCIYKTPYVAAPVREKRNVIARTPLYAQLLTHAPTRARIYLVHEWHCSQVTVLVKVLSPTSLFYEEATNKSSTIKGLLYHQRTLKTWERDAEWSAPTIARQIHGVSLPLGTKIAQRYDVPWDWLWDDAIWQGYVEDPAAKDFVARKARTIALSKAQGSCYWTSNNQPYSWVWKYLGNSLPKLYCVA